MLTLAGKALPVPILQGGMGVGVSLGGLAGAVAACGGMGCISTADAGYREPDFARDPAAANHRALTAEIQKAKALAKGAGLVAINAMVATQDYAAAIRTAVEAGVDAVVSGAGLPLELPGLVGTQEVAIAPIVSSARAAKLILRRWAKEFARTADFVVIEGCKAGGHLGFAEADLLADHCQSLDEILPEVLAEVQPYEAQFGHAIPVFVAGGIYTGADMAMLGRGCFGNPWLFARAQAALEGRPVPPLPPLARRCETAVRQFRLSAAQKGEHIACLEARKHYAWYLKGVPYAGYYKEQISKISTLEDIDRITAGIQRDLRD